MNALALIKNAGPGPISTLAQSKLLTAALFAALLCWLLTGDWIAAPSILLLAVIWIYVRGDEGPPVLALALTFQWLQVTSGLLYYGFTGRPLEAVMLSDYRPMVLVGLGCLTALAAGLVLGLRFGPTTNISNRPAFATAMTPLLLAYGASTVSIGILHTVAWRLSLLTQGILAVGSIRLILVYLLLRRLSSPRFRWPEILTLLAFEIGLGFTGYFAGFREPLMFFALVLLERFDGRKLRDWALVSALAAVTLGTGLIWLGIRTTYRSDIDLEALGTSRIDRAERLADLSSHWLRSGTNQILEDADFFVNRLWAIYYPALALQRVPSMLPHENGRILGAAVRHIFTPRLFFPDKPVLASDSELVRTYSGVWVAGTEANTSIAFGYAAESYVDFGIPVMFLPVFAFGLLMGLLYRLLLRLIWHRELAIGLVTVVFWLSLYLFERSWVKWLGGSLTLVIFLGGAVLAIDRVLGAHRQKSRVLQREVQEIFSAANHGQDPGPQERSEGTMGLSDPATGYLEWPMAPISVAPPRAGAAAWVEIVSPLSPEPTVEPAVEAAAQPAYRFPPPPWA